MNRRSFLRLSAAAIALLGLKGFPSVQAAREPEIRKPRPLAPGARIRVAQIGLAHQGSDDVRGFADEEIVALCDVDWSLGKVQNRFSEFPNARRYKDFRRMLLELDSQIDAVVISTPDHMHFLPAYLAIAMGKHVYVQKPLTQTIGEARILRELARKHGVCTQMGNQGHAGEGVRRVKEWYEAGVLGQVREVHVWTDRPIWPQGMMDRPKPKAAPSDLDWDLFLGRQQKRPYSKAYHPFDWRGWTAFGSGALGDMGCHLLDCPFWVLDLTGPVTISARSSGPVVETFPKWSIVTYQFPERGNRPPVTLTWYDGGKEPPRPADLEPYRRFSGSGMVMVGDKATVYDGNNYCNSPRIIPERKMQDMQAKLPPRTLPRVEKGNPYKEFTRAIREGKPHGAGSNFEYSAGLTELVLLGNLALRASGRTIEWDSEKMRVANLPELNRYVSPAYREGWTVDDLTKDA